MPRSVRGLGSEDNSPMVTVDSSDRTSPPGERARNLGADQPARTRDHNNVFFFPFEIFLLLIRRGADVYTGLIVEMLRCQGITVRFARTGQVAGQAIP
jgi:hypothetical protein